MEEQEGGARCGKESDKLRRGQRPHKAAGISPPELYDKPAQAVQGQIEHPGHAVNVPPAVVKQQQACQQKIAGCGIQLHRDQRDAGGSGAAGGESYSQTGGGDTVAAARQKAAQPAKALGQGYRRREKIQPLGERHPLSLAA